MLESGLVSTDEDTERESRLKKMLRESCKNQYGLNQLK